MCPISKKRKAAHSMILDLKEPLSFSEENDEDYHSVLRSLGSKECAGCFDLNRLDDEYNMKEDYRSGAMMAPSPANLPLGMKEEDTASKHVDKCINDFIGLDTVESAFNMWTNDISTSPFFSEGNNHNYVTSAPPIHSHINEGSSAMPTEIEKQGIENERLEAPHFDFDYLRTTFPSPDTVTVKSSGQVGTFDVLQDALEAASLACTPESNASVQTSHHNIKRELNDESPFCPPNYNATTDEHLSHNRSTIDHSLDNSRDANNVYAPNNIQINHTISEFSNVSKKDSFISTSEKKIDLRKIPQVCNKKTKKRKQRVVTPTNPSFACENEQKGGLQPKVYVETINDTDVLFGRGGKINHHLGNQKYLDRVAFVQPDHHKSCKHRKTQISHEIVQWVYGRGGRFLEKDTKTGKYFIVAHERARRKAAQALSEFKRTRN